jgi:inner membrane protein
VYLQALLAVLFGHLLPDAWTGWGTRLFLPWSAERARLDLTVVVDPMVTLPLLVAAVFAFRRRARDYRRPLWLGLGVTGLYLIARLGIQLALVSTVTAAYGAGEVNVFPAPLRVLQWRYVVARDDSYAVGVVELFGDPVEQGRYPRAPELAAGVRGRPIGDEVLAWARYPAIRVSDAAAGGKTVAIADLRYHAGGEPTLEFEIDLDALGAVRAARFNRGGSPRELLERFRR